MTATTQEDNAEIEWHQYCAAKGQAQREYEALYSKETSRNSLLMILSVVGLPAILIAIGLPALLSILGAPAAYFICMVSEKKSAELRDAEINSQNFESFEQWKNITGLAQARHKSKYANSYTATQSAPLLNFGPEICANTKKDKRIPSTFIAEKIDVSKATLKLSTTVRLLKAACKSIEAGKALRPHENLKLIIAEISKLQRRKYLDFPRLTELKLQIDNIKVRFDPFGDQYVWDQLRLGSEIMQEIIDLNFEDFERSSS